MIKSIVYLNSINIYLHSLRKRERSFTISSERSSAGRAQPCQGWGREFESRRSLLLVPSKIDISSNTEAILCPGGGIGRHAGLKILWLCGRAGSTPAPGTYIHS